MRKSLVLLYKKKNTQINKSIKPRTSLIYCRNNYEIIHCIQWLLSTPNYRHFHLDWINTQPHTLALHAVRMNCNLHKYSSTPRNIQSQNTIWHSAWVFLQRLNNRKCNFFWGKEQLCLIFFPIEENAEGKRYMKWVSEIKLGNIFENTSYECI